MNKDHVTGPFSRQDQQRMEQVGYTTDVTSPQNDRGTGEFDATVFQHAQKDSRQGPYYEETFDRRNPSTLLSPTQSTGSEKEYPGQFAHMPYPTVPPRTRPGRRQIAMIAVVASMAILAAMLLFPFLSASSQANTFAPAVVVSLPVGQVIFSSSGQLDPNSAQGINDIVTVTLEASTPPPPGHVFYAWLLPDQTIDEINPIMLGKFTLNHGNSELTYSDPNHTDLLAMYSTFRITEESSSTNPLTPSLDTAFWRYTGAIPNVPTPGDENHYSLLSHLRHLLAKDPSLQAIGLSGGLSIWLDRNSEKVLEYATAARDDWPNQGGNADLTHRQIARILQYLDGINYSWRDTPSGTPWLIDAQAGHIGLLDFSQSQQPPGYLSHILLHLNGLTNAPGSTPGQKQIAAQINAEMQSIVNLYKGIRSDASTLVRMSNQQLQQPDALSLLDSIATKANAAYAGQLDPMTGKTQGGISAIHGQLQTLGTFAIMPINK